ncbi:hypothetical protein [Paractinoplanes rishiriensis]|uniref:Uncharacterized protein n=1 Tax=Paractinoplanes rishiriensis TaxID=1050105 RepID=A0A919K9Z9_9ACTN|nr:hypothetical protein [Actinoplanes rishiriensis]GIF01224.1 hypothetical protein Ari01nite_86880 [Actinoplanes rishiriensis]
MSNFLAVLAAAGSIMLALGILYSTVWLMISGAAVLALAVVLAVLIAPRARRDR